MGGISTHVIGLISKDNLLYKNHKAVLDACVAAGVKNLPIETAKFFESNRVSSHLATDILERGLPYEEAETDMQMHYTVKVKDIPEEVEEIRFTNSW